LFTVQFEYYTVFLGWVITLCLGVFLLMFRTPKLEGYRNFNTARGILAAVFLLFAGEMMVQWLLRFVKPVSPVFSVSIYLAVFLISSFLITISYARLLLPHHINPRHMVWMAVVTVVYLLLLVVDNWLLHGWTQVNLLVFCAVFLFLQVCVLFVLAVRIYRRTISNLKRYYADYHQAFMRWMPGVGMGILVFELTAPVVCFSSRNVGIIQELLGIVLFVYTFICFINFAFYYQSVDQASSAADSDDDGDNEGLVIHNVAGNITHHPLGESLCEVLHDKHLQWQQAGGYRVTGVTIDQAAQAMGTNRTYLSQYINEVCNKTFYEWVRDMRVDEACQLLVNRRDLSVEQIAAMVGFSSSSNFSSTFKRVTGVTPLQWRRSH